MLDHLHASDYICNLSTRFVLLPMVPVHTPILTFPLQGGREFLWTEIFYSILASEGKIIIITAPSPLEGEGWDGGRSFFQIGSKTEYIFHWRKKDQFADVLLRGKWIRDLQWDWGLTQAFRLLARTKDGKNYWILAQKSEKRSFAYHWTFSCPSFPADCAIQLESLG